MATKKKTAAKAKKPYVAKLVIEFPRTQSERNRLVVWLRDTAIDIKTAKRDEYVAEPTWKLMR